MCGINGALVFQSSAFKITEPYLEKMRDAMAHRGPDGAGCWVSKDGRVGFGHRRLSIIDLSTSANQPMCNHDGSLWVTFNGEIYNHAEIRKELEAGGKYLWKTDHSDTEVILHAFEEWGIDCVRRFRGMFAIGLWDAKKEELWLIRDRVGIKPLYYSFHHGRLTFASEIKALLEDPDQGRKVNEESLFHFLTFLTAPAPFTLFEDIQKLPAGTWMKVTKDGRIQKKYYWDLLKKAGSKEGMGEDEAVERVLQVLRESVRLHKVSDVPVGLFLSGGVDSSTNASLFSESETRPVHTYTVGYEGKLKHYENELGYAALMAKKVGSIHHEVVLGPDDLMKFLPQMIYLQDEPISDPVCVPFYYLSKFAKQNGTPVCQLGEGVDELFMGYGSSLLLLLLQRLNDSTMTFNGLKKSVLGGLALLGRKKGRAYEYLSRGIKEMPLFWGSYESFTEPAKRVLLSPRLRDQFSRYSSWDDLVKPIHDRFLESPLEKKNLNWMAYVDLQIRLPELLLMRADKMSMGVAMEGRVPFLDHEFVELALSIPESVRIKNNGLKYIFKKSVRDIVPPEIVNRKKQGFGLPVLDWFEEKLQSSCYNLLSNFCEETDYLEWEEVQNYFNQRNWNKIWFLMNLALWWNRFIMGRNLENVMPF